MPEEALAPILAEYDDLLETLQTQMNLYKTEHNLLRNEMIKLLTQNEDLHKLVDSEFERRLQVDFSSEINPIINSEMVRNLRKQLQLSLDERKQLSEMFQVSQNQIAQLKGQIISRRSDMGQATRTQGPLTSALESKLETLSLELRMEKSAREDQESARLRAQTEAAKLCVLLDNQSEALEKLDGKKRELETKCNTFEQEITVLRATLECVTQSRDALETAFTGSERKVKSLQITSEEAKTKVEEAIEIAEKAVSERDSAMQRETHFQGEVSRLNNCLEHVAEEAARRINTEVKHAKENNDIKLVELVKEHQKMEVEVASLKKEIELLTRQCKQFQQECEGRKLIDEQAEGLTGEIMDLQSRLEFNKTQLIETKSALSEVLTENEKLTLEVEAATTREEQMKKFIGEMQTRVHNCRCERLRIKLNNLKTSKRKQTSELERQVTTQIALNEKWQKESERLAEQLEKKCQNIAKQTEKLKVRNKELKTKLKEAQTALYKCKN